MEQVNQSEMVPAQIPKFLKVLCILTFVGAGLGIVGGLYSLVKAPYALEEFEMMQDMTGSMQGMPGAGFMESVMDGAYAQALNALPLAINTCVANLLCLFGAMMMWKLRKVGFFAYLGGQLLGIIVPIVLVGFSGMFGGLMAFGAIFPVAFIIMYALNLKHMS